MPTPVSDTCIVLPPAYFPGAEYYALMARHSSVTFGYRRRFDKRLKSAHRMDIFDCHGPLTLTMPIEKPQSTQKATWLNIKISSHDNWPRRHWQALCTTYGATPFFEYYADDLRPLFADTVPGTNLVDHLTRCHELMLRLLGIKTHIVTSTDTSLTVSGDQRPSHQPPYWQIYGREFVPGLSALDLLCHIGPEAEIYIHTYFS